MDEEHNIAESPTAWILIMGYLQENEVIMLSRVSKSLQQLVHVGKTRYNLSCNYRLDADSFLNYALSSSCTSIDINYCEWLSATWIREVILKVPNIRHLHLLRCKVDEDCVRAICNIPLQSLSITYTREWRLWFEGERLEAPLAFAPTLLNFEMEYSNDRENQLPNAMFLDIYSEVLQFCKELQRLKLFGHPSFDFKERLEPVTYLSQSTSLLKLTSLEVCFDEMSHMKYCQKDLKNFLNAILADKVIPLAIVDVGECTGYLLEDGIFRHPCILPDKSTFRLSLPPKNMHYDDSYDTYEDIGSAHHLDINRYEKVFVKNIVFQDFEFFAHKIVSTSTNTLKELHFDYCFMPQNLVRGLEMFAFDCLHITVLHLTVYVSVFEMFGNVESFEENEGILKAISNFKNLKVLEISPSYLDCGNGDHQGIHKAPLFHVTKSCDQLIELRITSSSDWSQRMFIHIDSLYEIGYCKNLKVLDMNMFEVIGENNFVLATITNMCTKIEELHLRINFDFLFNYSLDLDDCLTSIKDLKTLTIHYGHEKCLTKEFVDSLLLCQKVECLEIWFSDYRGGSLNYITDGHGSELENLLEVLPKMTNLFVCTIYHDDLAKKIADRFMSFYETIKEEKPAFLGRKVAASCKH